MMSFPRVLGVAALLAACTRPAPAAAPPADFLLVAGDSTYWVTAGPSGVRMRGSPLILAHYDGRYHEVFVADDDHSYSDALIVGQNVYTRDLITDDSVAVFPDTLVGRIARAYVAAHPDEDPLGPDDDVADRPTVSATSDVALLDVAGPYLSIEYHADTRHRPGDAFHTTWRSVLDLRARGPVQVADLVGASEADRVVASGRRDYSAIVDSARVDSADIGDFMRAVLAQLNFDERSFILTHVGRRPAIGFAGRIAGRHDVEEALPLPAIPVDSAAWWSDVAATLPADSSDAGVRWTGQGYAVVARIDPADSVAEIAIVDSARHRWSVGQVHIPLRHVFWLDHPRVDSATRLALDRAFNEAALYDENAHVASIRRQAPVTGAIAARFTHPAPRAGTRPAPHRRNPRP